MATNKVETYPEPVQTDVVDWIIQARDIEWIHEQLLAAGIAADNLPSQKSLDGFRRSPVFVREHREWLRLDRERRWGPPPEPPEPRDLRLIVDHAMEAILQDILTEKASTTSKVQLIRTIVHMQNQEQRQMQWAAKMLLEDQRKSPKPLSPEDKALAVMTRDAMLDSICKVQNLVESQMRTGSPMAKAHMAEVDARRAEEAVAKAKAEDEKQKARIAAAYTVLREAGLLPAEEEPEYDEEAMARLVGMLVEPPGTADGANGEGVVRHAQIPSNLVGRGSGSHSPRESEGSALSGSGQSPAPADESERILPDNAEYRRIMPDKSQGGAPPGNRQPVFRNSPKPETRAAARKRRRKG